MARKRSPKSRPVPEREVMAQCVEAAMALGVKLSRRNVGMAMNPSGQPVRFGTAGEADLYGQLPDGRRLEVEVKRKGKRPRPEQLAFLRSVNAGGGAGVWADDPGMLVGILGYLMQGWRAEVRPNGDVAVIEPETAVTRIEFTYLD